MLKRYVCMILAAAMAVAMAFGLTGCGVDDIDISEYAKAEIVLDWNGETEQTVTVEQLKGMDCVTKKTESTSDKIGVVRATGPLLTTVMENYGYSLEDFSKVKFYGADDYDISLQKDFLMENDCILAFGINGEPNGEDSRPIRVIIPESDSAYWIRLVTRIEFIK